MPLVKSKLLEEFRKFADEEFSDFQGFPESSTEAAEAWANMFDAYGSGVTPSSSTSSQAKETFKATLSGASFGTWGQVLQTAATQYASILGSGMSGFVSVPPASPLTLDPAFVIGDNKGTTQEVGEVLSSIIDAWFRTGTATPSGGGSTIPWS